MYHLSIKSISRSDGRSATAAAAYRAGAEIEDLRTGEVHSYKRKRDVVKEHSGIVLPPGSPSWATDRSALWNAAETAEKRKNSRVARDYEVTIPRELTVEQGADLVRDFAHAISDRYGVAVDYNLHRDDPRTWDGSEKGYQGYHAHILTTTRTLGAGGFGAKSAIEMSDTQRRALGLGDMSTEIEKVRQLWEVAANRHLERAGIDRRIDRRSLKDQGIDREPTIHLGPAVAAFERHGLASRMGDFNRQVVAAGKERDRRSVALRELGDEIAVLERPVEAKPAKPKRARAIDLSVLDDVVEDKDSEKKRQAGLEQRRAEREGEERERAHQERQDRARRERERQVSEERKAAVAWALEEIERQKCERVLRVQAALREAKERRNHREGVLERLKQSRPEPPRGLLAGFKEKAHRQAVVAWDEAVKVAAKLADRGRRLVERVSQLARPEQVKRWAEEVVRKVAPQAVAWYEQEQGRERAERRAQEEAKEQAREQATKDAQRLVAERAVRAEAAAQEQRKASRLTQLERDADRMTAMVQKANNEPLAMTLYDKQQLLASLTAVGRLHDAGVRQLLNPEVRARVETDRQMADRLVAAEMFRLTPRSETLRHYPGLAREYGLLDEVEQFGWQRGLNSLQQGHEYKQARQQLASAIETGQQLRIQSDRLELIQEISKETIANREAEQSTEKRRVDNDKKKLDRGPEL